MNHLEAIQKINQRLFLRRIQLRRAWIVENEIGLDDEICEIIDILIGKIGGLEIYRMRLLRKADLIR